MDKNAQKKAARINEALRLNAMDDMSNHVVSVKNYQSSDLKALRKIIRLIVMDKPAEASELYQGLDTFIRERIPDGLDEWLRATACERSNG